MHRAIFFVTLIIVMRLFQGLLRTWAISPRLGRTSMPLPKSMWRRGCASPHRRCHRAAHGSGQPGGRPPACTSGLGSLLLGPQTLRWLLARLQDEKEARRRQAFKEKGEHYLQEGMATCARLPSVPTHALHCRLPRPGAHGACSRPRRGPEQGSEDRGRPVQGACRAAFGRPAPSLLSCRNFAAAHLRTLGPPAPLCCPLLCSLSIRCGPLRSHRC